MIYVVEKIRWGVLKNELVFSVADLVKKYTNIHGHRLYKGASNPKNSMYFYKSKSTQEVQDPVTKNKKGLLQRNSLMVRAAGVNELLDIDLPELPLTNHGAVVFLNINGENYCIETLDSLPEEDQIVPLQIKTEESEVVENTEESEVVENTEESEEVENTEDTTVVEITDASAEIKRLKKEISNLTKYKDWYDAQLNNDRMLIYDNLKRAASQHVEKIYRPLMNDNLNEKKAYAEAMHQMVSMWHERIFMKTGIVLTRNYLKPDGGQANRFISYLNDLINKGDLSNVLIAVKASQDLLDITR